MGIIDSCTPELGGIPGVSSRDQCGQMPVKLQAGCFWRFGWFPDAGIPDFDSQQVRGPAQQTAITGCVRGGDVGFPAAPGW